ncbi:MAG: hypothetical protein P1U56_25140 [Saprospiraceae bacterium]|nr:hypothetical protein [Saprospiraceae bacterium]
MDPFSAGFVLYVLKSVNDLTDGWAEDVVKGVTGNIADRLLVSSGKGALAILRSRKEKDEGNHDLMKALRRSMLLSTKLIRQEMKDEKEERAFRRKLQKWIDKQIKELNNLDSWHDWNNPAIENLELFFDGALHYQDMRADLAKRMTASWLDYLRSCESLKEIPSAFSNKLIDGWIDSDVKITWWELVVTEMKTYLRNGKDPQALKAEKALVHNFLADLKLELKTISIDINVMKPLLSDLWNEMINGYPNIQKAIENQWYVVVDPIIKSINMLSETNRSQQETIKSLVLQNENLLNNNKDLSSNPDELNIDETRLLLYSFVNNKRIYTYSAPGYELLCVRCGYQYFGYEYHPEYVYETNNNKDDPWIDPPKNNPPNARINRLHWLAVLESLFQKEFINLVEEKSSQNRIFELSKKGQLYADAVIQWRLINDPEKVPKPSYFE